MKIRPIKSIWEFLGCFLPIIALIGIVLINIPEPYGNILFLPFFLSWMYWLFGGFKKDKS